LKGDLGVDIIPKVLIFIGLANVNFSTIYDIMNFTIMQN